MNTFNKQWIDLINSTESINIRLFEITDKDVIFYLFEGNLLKNEIYLPIGYEQIAAQYFEHNIPTVAEVDYAINVIEDELMSNKSLISNNAMLICSDKILIDILTQNIELKNIFTRQEIEDLFSKYANVSMGEPLSRYNLDINPNNYATMLILREIMHHLNYKELNTPPFL
jgi:hypothetical protein